MRLIDADAFDKYLLGAEIEATKSRKYVFRSAINTIRGNLANFPTVNQWIPCSERLPEEGERVLCTHLGGLNPNRQVIEHIYQNGKFVLGWDMDMNPSSSTFGQRYMGKVIAWMPLPEPWKGEVNDA
jgi:hypothetical protein